LAHQLISVSTIPDTLTKFQECFVKRPLHLSSW